MLYFLKHNHLNQSKKVEAACLRDIYLIKHAFRKRKDSFARQNRLVESRMIAQIEQPK